MTNSRWRLIGPLGTLLAVAALTMPATATAPGPARAAPLVGDCTPGANWGTARGDYAGQVLALVNAHRTSMGLSPLNESPTLDASAYWKALHMAAYGYMAHDDPAPPVARTAGQRIAACGYTSGWWGENIAYGHATPDSVMQAWLSSPGHRANIENPSYRAIGVGAAVSSGGTMTWVQDFGAVDDSATGSPPPRPPPPPPPPPSPPKPPPKPAAPPPKPPAPPPKPPAPPPKPPASPGAPTAPATTRGQPSPSAPAVASAPAAAKTSSGSTTVHIGLSALEAISSLPHAGHRFAAALIVHSGSGRRVLAGGVGCRARIGHRHVRVVVNAFRDGAAVCAYRVPRWAHGRLFRGLIHVRSHGGAQTSHVFGRRIR